METHTPRKYKGKTETVQKQQVKKGKYAELLERSKSTHCKEMSVFHGSMGCGCASIGFTSNAEVLWKTNIKQNHKCT